MAPMLTWVNYTTRYYVALRKNHNGTICANILKSSNSFGQGFKSFHYIHKV